MKFVFCFTSHMPRLNFITPIAAMYALLWVRNFGLQNSSLSNNLSNNACLHLCGTRFRKLRLKKVSFPFLFDWIIECCYKGKNNYGLVKEFKIILNACCLQLHARLSFHLAINKFIRLFFYNFFTSLCLESNRYLFNFFIQLSYYQFVLVEEEELMWWNYGID